jgi:hypothetical protein
MVAHDLLANEGALVTVADNGKAAIEAINNAEPLFDVVLMDIQMPGMDGYEATRNIRERYDSKQLPIIAMTANALLDHQEKAISAKMNGFISKPFNLDDLVTLIQEQLSKETPKSSKIKIKTAPPSVVNIFNTSAAIDRFGGNEQVFYKALANFIIDVNRALDHLPKALDDSFDEVCATIHSLKGLTSTFGADVFHEKAVETYKRLNQATQPTKSTWTKMRRALISSGQEALAEGARLLTSLELETAQKTNSSAHDSSSFQKKLALLLDYLKTNNMEALKIYEQLKHEHTENTSDAFVKLGQSIDQLDFLKATNYCQHLINTVLGGKK